MEENIWDLGFEEIKDHELTEEEKKIVKEYAKLEMDIEEAISMIDFIEEEK